MAEPVRYTRKMIEYYTRRGQWTTETQADIWDRNASKYQDKVALVDARGQLTWAKAKLWTDRVALNLLDMGFVKDDAVVVQLPTSKELLMMLIACEKAGLIYVPVMRNFGEKELRPIISKTKSRGIVIPWKFRNTDYYEIVQKLLPDFPHLQYIIFWDDEHPKGNLSLSEMAERPIEKEYAVDKLQQSMMSPFEVCLVRTTSGTTGIPKIVELPSCCRVFQARTLVQVLGMSDRDIVAAMSPVFGGPNTPAYLGAPMAASKIVMLEKWDPEEALSLIEQERVTLFGAVPTQLFQMIQHPNFSRYDLSSLRLVAGGMGQALSYKLGVEAEKKLGCPILNTYGVTEWGGTLMTSPLDPQQIRFNTVGKCSDKGEVKIIDSNGNELPLGEEGELLVGGPASSSGYFKDSKSTWDIWTSDGWLRTGDIARLDKYGNVMICGRSKDMIIRAGLNIYPSEIENLLLMHSKVSNAAVVAMPDAVMGEKLCAYLVPKEGQGINFDEIVTFLKKKGLSTIKIPERLEIMSKLPFGRTGEKIDKEALRKDIERKLKAEGKI
jgi:non-ribosomal peptide synthetase component E (peptide arylation enzyme)